MKKCILVAGLMAFGFVQSQVSDSLQTIEVFGKTPKKINEIAENLIVISSTDLQESAGITLEEILQQQAGIQIQVLQDQAVPNQGAIRHFGSAGLLKQRT